MESQLMNRFKFPFLAATASLFILSDASVTETVPAVFRHPQGTQTGAVYDIVDTKHGSKRYFLSTFPSIDSDTNPQPSLLRQMATSTPESILPANIRILPGSRRLATDHSGRYVCFTSNSEVLDPIFDPIGGHAYFLDTETGSTRKLVPIVNGLLETRYLAGLSGDGKSALIAGYLNRDRFFLMNTTTGLGKEVLKAGNASNVISSLRLVPNQPAATFVSTSPFFGGSTSKQAVVYADLNTGAYEVLNIPAPGATVTSEFSIDDVKVSDDGRYVAFSSTAAYILGDTNNRRDVYRYDRTTDVLERVSFRPGGAPLTNDTEGWDLNPAGTKLAFTTSAPNSDIYVWSAATSATTSKLTNYGPDPVSWSEDGIHLYLYKQGPYNGENKWWLAPAMPYRFNPETLVTQTLIKPNLNTLEGVAFDNDEVELAPSAGSAVFASQSSDYAPAVDGFTQSAFWLDVASRRAVRMSKAISGPENGWSHSVNISADGKFAAFSSSSSNLIPGTPASTKGYIYLYNRAQDRLKVLVFPDSILYGSKPKVSNDGKYVVFIGGYVHQPSGRLANGIFVWTPDNGSVKRVNNDVGVNVFYDIQNLHINATGSVACFDASGQASTPRRIVRLDIFRGRTTILPGLYGPEDNILMSMSRDAERLLIAYGTAPVQKYAVVGATGAEVKNLSVPALQDGIYLASSWLMEKAKLSSDGRYVTLYSQISGPGQAAFVTFQTFYDLQTQSLQVSSEAGFEYTSLEGNGQTAISAYGGMQATLNGQNDFLITTTGTGLAAARLGSPQSSLQYRFRYAGGDWSTWASSGQAPYPASNANGNYRIEGQVRAGTVESRILKFTLKR